MGFHVSLGECNSTSLWFVFVSAILNPDICARNQESPYLGSAVVPDIGASGADTSKCTFLPKKPKDPT